MWDILLETVANCTRQKEDDIIERLIPVLEQCEPWGGQMHDEQVRKVGPRLLSRYCAIPLLCNMDWRHVDGAHLCPFLKVVRSDKSFN